MTTTDRLPYGELKARILALHNEHPDWSCRRVAEELGRDIYSVRTAAHAYGIKFRRVCRERLPDRITRSVNFTKAEFERLSREARNAGLSFSAYAAQRLLGHPAE